VKNLPDLSQLVSRSNGKRIESCWNESAIQYLSAGTVFAEHTHQEHEYIILVTGSMKRSGEGVNLGPCKDGAMQPGGGAYFPPNCPHGLEILEDSCVVGVTVPASESYP
jgi:quercetin dioxygenase-like cupin family protein